MARDNEVKTLMSEIDKLISFKKDDLIHRQPWGAITFESARRDLDRVFDIVSHLKILPLENLADDTISSITTEVRQSNATIDKIDKFNIEASSGPAQTRDTLVNEVHTRADSLFKIASPWIPFLAYQKGDVSKNITQLTTKLTDAQILLDTTKTDINLKSAEINDIIIKAREASASAGAAVFTEDFMRESKELFDRAKSWLFWTGTFALVTLISAALMWIFVEKGLEQNEIWQKLTTKLAVLAILISATAWCGKIYKALMHQSTSYKFRALGLQTFQAFSHSASNEQTKDAVLLQTTRAIFSDSGTGFVDSHSSSDSDIKMLEVVKSVLPRSNN